MYFILGLVPFYIKIVFPVVIRDPSTWYSLIPKSKSKKMYKDVKVLFVSNENITFILLTS